MDAGAGESASTLPVDPAGDGLSGPLATDGGNSARGPDLRDLSAPWRGLNATADSLGLALLGAVVQDLAVTPAEAGVGTRVAMSWPLEG
jgi:hypothetical protein